MAKNDRFVVNRGDKWAVVKPSAKRASAVVDKQAQGEKRAKEIVRNLGGAEVRIQARMANGVTPTPSRPPRIRFRPATRSIE